MPAPPRSDDPLPCDAIRLSEAFERYYRTAFADAAEAIETELNAAFAEYQGPKGAKAEWERWIKAGVAHDKLQSEAERSFRNALAAGRPAALVRDPATGVILKLDYRVWNAKQNFGVPGFSDDFVGPDELVQPGPSAVIGGMMRPVFFNQAEFESWLTGNEPAEAVERWSIPECAPRGRLARLAYDAIKKRWRDGPPKKLSPQEIANTIKTGCSAETVRRLLS
jgi:hypothetical protein